MKITTKFAYTGLILSILSVHPSLANAKEKPVIDVASLKSCNLQDTESENPCKEEELATKYGKLILASHIPDDYGSTLFFRGKLISNTNLGGNLGFEKIFDFQSSEVVLILSTDGNAPENYIFLRVMPDGSVKFSNSILEAIEDSTKNMAQEKKDGYNDGIFDQRSDLKPIQNGDQIVFELSKSFEGTRRIATYESDHVSIKRIESKSAMQTAKEKNCKDTYVNYKRYINPIGGTGFSCGDQSVNYSNAENRSHMFLGANFGNAIRYTCKTHKLIDFSTFKKIVCIDKKQ